MSHANLWAPWRLAYLKQSADQPPAAKPTCFLCEAAATKADDPAEATQLLLLNDQRGILMLNRYPYTNGHLLIAPHDHVGMLSDLSAPQRAGLMELAALAERLLKTAVHAQGVNVGINLGSAAGAGVPGHLHMHAAPRWAGDVNFMEVIGQVRVVPQALEDSYELLKAVLPEVA